MAARDCSRATLTCLRARDRSRSAVAVADAKAALLAASASARAWTSVTRSCRAPRSSSNRLIRAAGAPAGGADLTLIPCLRPGGRRGPVLDGCDSPRSAGRQAGGLLLPAARPPALGQDLGQPVDCPQPLGRVLVERLPD